MTIAGKWVKIFKKWTDDEPYVTLDKTDNEQQSEKDHGDVESEESGLQLVCNIRGESENDMDGGEYRASATSAHTGECAGLEGASVVV